MDEGNKKRWSLGSILPSKRGHFSGREGNNEGNKFLGWQPSKFRAVIRRAAIWALQAINSSEKHVFHSLMPAYASQAEKGAASERAAPVRSPSRTRHAAKCPPKSPSSPAAAAGARYTSLGTKPGPVRDHVGPDLDAGDDRALARS
jgi:hypothetical protein